MIKELIKNNPENAVKWDVVCSRRLNRKYSFLSIWKVAIAAGRGRKILETGVPRTGEGWKRALVLLPAEGRASVLSAL